MRLHLVALALTALLASGCFVFEELDKGDKILDAHSPTRSAAAKEKAAAEAKAASGQAQQGEGEPKKSWWETARTLSSADQAPTDDPNVRCRIDGKERFMRQSDCLTQGGRPDAL